MTQQAVQLQLMPSTNPVMANYLLDAETYAERAARHALQQSLEAHGTSPEAYTTPQLRAMVKLEQLKIEGDLELAAVLLRGKLIQEIEREGLWSIHPNQYSSMQEAAVANGLSLSEYSDIRNLYNTVFPYITGTLGLDLAHIWEEIGKSNFRELTPVLVRLITGHASQSRRVEELVERMSDDIHASYEAAGQAIEEEQMVQEAVDTLLQAGTLPNRELRQVIRPERTPSFASYITEIQYQGQPQKIVISIVDPDQLSLFRRRMSGYMDAQAIELDQLAHSPLIRAITGGA
jgi:hypothetical protein